MADLTPVPQGLGDAPAPAAPKPGLLAVVLGFLVSGTGRRLLVFLLGLVVPVIDQHFKLNLDPQVMVADLGVVAAYILGSNIKAAVDSHSDAKVIAAQAAGVAASKASPGALDA